jgi:hypothetical protein
MDSQRQSINLLRMHSALSSEEAVILSRLKIVAIVMAVFVLLCGVFVTIAFFAARIRLDTVTAEKSNTLKLIAFNSRKEALLVGLKERIPLINGIINNQYSWNKITDAVTQIISPPFLKSITINTNNVLTLGIEVGSLEEMNDIVQKTEELTKLNKIKNPRIESLDTQGDGTINSFIVFTPIL